jgi:hypothetical protein
MGFLDAIKNVWSKKKEYVAAPKVPESFDILELKEESQLRQLLSNFQLLHSKLYAFKYHYLNQILQNAAVASHVEISGTLYKLYDTISELTNIIQRDSLMLVTIAKTVQRLMQHASSGPENSDAIAQENEVVEKIITLEPFIQQLTSLLSYCVSSMKEIKSRSRTRAGLLFSDVIGEDAKAIDRTLHRLFPMINSIVITLEQLIHMKEKFPSKSIELIIDKDIKAEREDINRLTQLLTHLYDKLYVASLSLWSTSAGKINMIKMLEEYLIPHLQMIVQFCNNIGKQVKDVEENLIETSNEIDKALETQQNKIISISNAIRSSIEEFENTISSPILNELKSNRPNRRKTDKLVNKALAVLLNSQKEIDSMKQLMEASENIEKVEEMDRRMF